MPVLRDAKSLPAWASAPPYIDGENDDGAAIALGGPGRRAHPGYDRIALWRLCLRRPEVLYQASAMSTYYDIGVSVGYEHIVVRSVYVGWRQVEADIDPNGDRRRRRLPPRPASQLLRRS